MGLYHRVAHGNTFYIADIVRDTERGRLTLNFLGDPDQPEVVRVLTFTGVRDFSEQWEEDRIESLIQSLIGLVESPQSDGIHYEIILDEVVMTFTTREQPQAVDLVLFSPCEE